MPHTVQSPGSPHLFANRITMKCTSGFHGITVFEDFVIIQNTNSIGNSNLQVFLPNHFGSHLKRGMVSSLALSPVCGGLLIEWNHWSQLTPWSICNSEYENDSRIFWTSEILDE